MIVEIRNAGFVNKGATMMLLSIIENFRKQYPDAKIAMHAAVNAPYIKRAQLGLYQKIHFRRYGIAFDHLLKFVPKGIRKRIGLILDSEIDVIFDAAGFAYSDQWGNYMAKNTASDMKRWKKQGTKVIMMPQAFGPFEQTDLQQSMKKIIDLADLIYAREEVSYNYLTKLAGGEKANLKQSPDFTNLLKAEVPKDFDSNTHKVCIVPNMRMIDKTFKGEAQAYIDLMANAVNILSEKEAKAFFLIHEGKKDRELAEKIMQKAGKNIPVIEEDDALRVKGIIGACEAMIGSRFHGLVSALAQGIPALGTGWSHKYQMLYKDYNFEEGLLKLQGEKNQLQEKIDLILDDKSRRAVIDKITQAGKQQKELVRKMWEEIFALIDNKK